jgi:hypothetical protein
MTKKQLQQRIEQLETELTILMDAQSHFQVTGGKEIEAQTGRIERSLDIVYPHVEKFAQWEELKFSLRSVEKNLRGIDFNVFIVGDLPDWASDRVIHIPCEYTGKTPRIDILYKHTAVRECEEVDEEYIWMNDDIYLVNPVQYADLCLPVASGNLASDIRRMPRQTTWGRDNEASLEMLRKEKLPAFNYGVHIPHRYEKQKVALLVEKYAMMDQPIVLEQIYYNYWFRDFKPYLANLDMGNNIAFSINRQNPSAAALRAHLQVKKFMNNSEAGMGNLVKETLKQLFPEPSIFER